MSPTFLKSTKTWTQWLTINRCVNPNGWNPGATITLADASVHRKTADASVHRTIAVLTDGAIVDRGVHKLNVRLSNGRLPLTARPLSRNAL
jgi:hypothetical protein